MRKNNLHIDEGFEQKFREKWGDKTPFQVPDKYFDSLAGAIQSKTSALKAKPKPVTFIQNMFFSPLRYGVAAVLLFITGLFFVFNYLTTNSSDFQLNKITNNSIVEQALISDYSEEMLIESLIQKENILGQSSDFVNLTNINDDDIIDYLILEKVSNTDLVFTN